MSVRAIRSGIAGSLPAGLLYARDLALVRELSEAYSANAILAKVSMRSSADPASVVLSGGELCRTLLFNLH